MLQKVDPREPNIAARVDEVIADSRTHPYQLFMLVLCVYVLLALAAQTLMPLPPDVVFILDAVDTAICAVFLADFLGNLILRKDRLAYLKWGWIDLISSIPALNILRWGRVARIIRIVRVLRAVRSTRMLASYVLGRRAESAVLTVILVALLLVAFSSVAVLQLERGGPGPIQTPEDALWWAFVTVTTVGYGDQYPVTTEGRLVAALLMTGGVALFSTCTGFVASWFLRPSEDGREKEIVALRDEIAALRAVIVEQRNS